MTTLQPTKSRGGLRNIPWWVVLVGAAMVGVLLIGTGLLLTQSDDEAAPTAAPVCTPSAAAITPPAKAVKVNVYNATERAGLARAVADSFEARGFTIDSVDNDPKNATVSTTAVVRYESGSTTQARWVAAQVPGATIIKVSAKGRDGAKVDLVVGDAYSELAEPADAVTAFAASAPKPVC